MNTSNADLHALVFESDLVRNLQPVTSSFIYQGQMSNYGQCATIIKPCLHFVTCFMFSRKIFHLLNKILL